MDQTTFQTIIRDYAKGVDSGAYDSELSRQERKFVVLLLNTASNDGAASQAYLRLGQDVREAIIRRFIDAQWNANVGTFIEVASSTARTAYGTAFELAITILRSI